MEKKLFKQDTLYKVAKAFLRWHKVRVTNTSLRKALGAYDAEANLAVLTDTFARWNIDTMAVRIKSHQLAEIDLPAIAYISEGELNYFVLLTKFKDGYVEYLDAEDGPKNEPLDAFSQKWAGITLLALPDEKSGEADFAKKRRQEIRTNFGQWAPWAIALLALVWGMAQHQAWPLLLLSVVKAVGVALSLALLVEEYGSANAILERICKVNTQTDCHSVLDSPAAKLFGWLGMAEIGLVYFSGGLLAVSIAGYAGIITEIMPIIAWMSAFALPYTLFSFYYQGLVIKKWCPLCVSVQGLLWVEFALVWNRLDLPTSLSANNIVFLLLCFGVPAALWLLVKPMVLQKNQAVTLRTELARFRENSELFRSLLEAKPAQSMQYVNNELILGRPEAPVTLTMVSGPFCPPCEKAHASLERLLSDFPNQLRVIVRFVVNRSDSSDVRNQLATYLLNLADQHPDQLPQALAEWYHHRKIDQLISRFPAEPSSTGESLLQEHIKWYDSVGIEYTPTFFVNGYRFPKHYIVDDLRYHLDTLAESTPLQTT